MGTYTTNYNLFMPTVGETGWGTLVNGNFTTIDTAMKGLDTRLTAVESEVNGALSCTSVTTSGKITGNGGIAGTTGTFSGAVTGKSFNGVILKSSGTITVTPNNTQLGKLPGISVTGSITVLPVCGALYSGSIRLYNTVTNTQSVVSCIGTQTQSIVTNIEASSYGDITFSNVPFLVLTVGNAGTGLKLCKFTLS